MEIDTNYMSSIWSSLTLHGFPWSTLRSCDVLFGFDFVCHLIWSKVGLATEGLMSLRLNAACLSQSPAFRSFPYFHWNAFSVATRPGSSSRMVDTYGRAFDSSGSALSLTGFRRCKYVWVFTGVLEAFWVPSWSGIGVSWWRRGAILGRLESLLAHLLGATDGTANFEASRYQSWLHFLEVFECALNISYFIWSYLIVSYLILFLKIAACRRRNSKRFPSFSIAVPEQFWVFWESLGLHSWASHEPLIILS